MKKYGSWTEQETSKFRTSGDNKEVSITPPSTLTGASNTFTTPNISGTTDTLVGRASSDTGANRLQNKDLSADNVGFVDNTDVTKKLIFDLTGITTATTRTIVVPDTDDTLVTLAAAQTLTNKTIDGDNNTLTDLALSVLKTTANLNVFLQRDGSGDVIDSTKAVPTGDVVGTSDSQTLTNKTLTTPQVNEAVNLTATSTELNQLDGVTVGGTTAGDIATIDGTQVLTNKTLTAPQINDTSADHQYVFGVSELTLDRTVTLPLLTGDDTFVFAAHAETLTNKTIDADNNTISNLAHGAEVDNPTSGVHGVTGNVVGTSDTQTLTNKTIDADLNTVTNIENADIKTGAAIDAAKIHDGSVSNTEFGYLNGVTSAIQTQIDSKQDDVITTRGDIVYGNISGVATRLPIGTVGQVLTSDGTDVSWDSPAGTGDVTSASNIADNRLVRGDGGAKGIQQSGITVDDSNNITGVAALDTTDAITVTDTVGADTISTLLELYVISTVDNGGALGPALDFRIQDTSTSTTDPQARIHVTSTGAADTTQREAGGQLIFSTHNQDTGGSVLERMRITSDGEVGIGVTEPEALFHSLVSSGIVMRAERTATSSERITGLEIVNDSSVDQDGNMGAYIDYRLEDNNTVVAEPHAQIGIQGSGTASQDAESGGNIHFRVRGPNLASGTVNTRVIFTDDGSTYAFKTGGGAWGSISDERIKQNISPINDALGKMRALQPKHFEYINAGLNKNPTGTRTGFIAQEFEQVLPGHVVSHEPMIEEDRALVVDENGIALAKAIDADLIPYLVKALQELADKNDALEARITALENA